MKKRVSLLILACLIISLAASGCFDAAEVDDEVYALNLGLDKGSTNKLRLTIQYPTYKSGGGGGGQGQDSKNKGGMGESNEAPGANTHTIEASTILEALDMYGMSISRRVSLMHAKNLIISEELAKTGMERYLGPLARYRETRRVMNVAVVKGTAQDFIKADKSNIGESQAKAIELMASQADNTSFFPRVTFYDFYRQLLSPYEHGYVVYAGINDFSSLPEKTPDGGELPLLVDKGFEPGKIPRSGVAKREYVGTAVFFGDKMVGSLNSEETRFFLIVKGQFKRGIIVIKDERSPGDAIPLDMRLSRKPAVKGYYKKGKPVIDLKLEMEADIGAIQSRINYENKDEIEKLNKQAEDHIKERVLNVIEKCRNEYKTDIFGFGRKFAGYFPTIQEWEEYNWLSHFSEVEVKVHVNVNIRRTGLMIGSSKVRKGNGH